MIPHDVALLLIVPLIDIAYSRNGVKCSLSDMRIDANSILKKYRTIYGDWPAIKAEWVIQIIEQYVHCYDK